MDRIDIKSLTFDELSEQVRALGLPAYRAGQIYQWLHVKRASSFDEMSSLPQSLREQLAGQFELITLRQAEVLVSAIDGTRKYLFALPDGNVIESVLMRYRHGNSVCVSSQVGCRMGCRFCASTLDGLVRNLRPSEMLDQVYRIGLDIGERISNVVVMGSGEPLDNYDNLLRFIRLLSDECGLHISQRNITVSTCGLVPQMRKLAEEGLQITLALSLHAESDTTRRKLMPVAVRYPLSEVLDACHTYYGRTGRRVTFEYSLVRGVNDGTAQAAALARLLKDQHGHVNLIPVNPIKERDYVQSERKSVEAFKNQLEKSGINVTIRREMGRDVNGACGQLRRSYLHPQGPEDGAKRRQRAEQGSAQRTRPAEKEG